MTVPGFTVTAPDFSPSSYFLEGLYIVLLPFSPLFIAFFLPGLARAPETFCSRGELLDFKNKLILLNKITPEIG